MQPADYVSASDGTGEAVRSVITTERLIGATTLITDSVLHWPNKFIATSGTLDPVTGILDEDTITVFKGYLTGSIITIDEYAPGYTDIGHEVGQVVVLKPSTLWADIVRAYLDDLTAFTEEQTHLAFVKNEVVGGTMNGVNTSFTLSASAVTGTVELYKNGVRLNPGAGNDYTVSGSAITMAAAPAASTVLLADYATNTSVFQNGITGIVTNQVPTGAVNGSNTSFTTSTSYVAGTLEVWVNGLKQLPTTHYTETTPASGVFTLGDAPLTGDNVLVNYQHTLSSLSDADKVDGFNASATPMANTLLPLNANAKIQQSVIQNDCKFSAYPTSNQATVANTWTKINNGTEEYDTGSNYNAGTSVFTAPATGYYSFTVGCLFNTQPGTAVLIGIGKNWTSGAETKRLGEIPNCTGNTTLTGTIEIYLTSGDTIVPLYYTASVTTLLSGSVYGRFQGKYVGA